MFDMIKILPANFQTIVNKQDAIIASRKFSLLADEDLYGLEIVGDVSINLFKKI